MNIHRNFGHTHSYRSDAHSDWDDRWQRRYHRRQRQGYLWRLLTLLILCSAGSLAGLYLWQQVMR